MVSGELDIRIDRKTNRVMIAGPLSDPGLAGFWLSCSQGTQTTVNTAAPAGNQPGKRTMSAAGRKRIAEAVRKRHEANRTAAAPANNAPAPTAKGKGKKTKEVTQAVGAGAGV